MARCTRLLGALALAGLPIAAHAAETITYSYDALGRLVTVAHSGTVNPTTQITYTFDNADNRSAYVVTGSVSKVVVVPLNGLTVIPIPDN